MLRWIKNSIVKVCDFTYPVFSRFMPRLTYRYAFTGGLNTAFDIFLYFVFYNFILKKNNLDFGIIVISSHIAAFLIVFPITFTTGFLLAKYVTFTQSVFRGHKQLFRYGVSVTGSIILNYVLLKFFVEVCFIWPTISKILTTGIVILYSYFMQKYFSFNVRTNDYK